MGPRYGGNDHQSRGKRTAGRSLSRLCKKLNLPRVFYRTAKNPRVLCGPSRMFLLSSWIGTALMTLPNVLAIAALVFGFGFVVFFHELGHFLAAKWVGIKVEQFAVGFGHAMLAFRKGLGLRVGSTTKEFEQKVREHAEQKHSRKGDLSSAELSAAAEDLGLGETEYRLNWMPLGGYVKMLGQDDLNPGAQSDDPRAYNRKSIGARMFVVSAGVIMNVILAAIFFMIVFLMGFNVPPSMVGGIK